MPTTRQLTSTKVLISMDAPTSQNRLLDTPLDMANALEKALICHEQGDLHQAVDLYREAFPFLPLSQRGRVAYLLGTILLRHADYQESEKYLRTAIEVNPSVADYHRAYGLLLEETNRTDDASLAYQRALSLDPTNHSSALSYANLLIDKGQYDDAISICRQAETTGEDQARLLNTLGVACKRTNQIEKAIKAFSQAISLNPFYAAAYINRATVRKAQSRWCAAINDFRAALSIDPDNANVRLQLAVCLKKPGRIEDAITECHLALKASQCQVTDFRTGHLMLASLYEQKADYARAFRHYSIAREYHQKDEGISHDNGYTYIRWIRSRITRSFFSSHGSTAHPTRRPIFVVGMPRSGTSLVEQMLDCHPLVHGAGELGWISEKTDLLVQQERNGGTRLEDIPENQVKAIANGYLNYLDTFDNKAKHVVDKNCHNFAYLWFIVKLFPKATIIHCRRNPMATCWSIFTNPFENGHGYANSFLMLGRYYSEYLKVMKHWETVLPLKIHHVDYESLVREPEPVIRGLLTHCSLPFHSECLTPHLNKREIKTASAEQVRKPIYTTRISHWRNYKKFLTDLEKALNS
ncbi:tetratricopeptide repeat-containing sulfotransferase family protein [Thiorhodovibrio frisius]|uniref:Tetratricopeptide repeat protein,sulfotransferase family protein n=1 Tax=Thiorhodovibrio frisius TaxID=631362 RepID=H8Z5B9_9GAMM|nr:sulfotransferase [Thiorhodovibrio frisius]EIC20526.1 tetratricopeptide repeat protein,sulfotransferase family protein [Thiorhodovibrio frisius]WPL21271.1 bacteriophage N4 receptor, outer membrane subunit [Thiorhodovibrio frisius]